MSDYDGDGLEAVNLAKGCAALAFIALGGLVGVVLAVVGLVILL